MLVHDAIAAVNANRVDTAVPTVSTATINGRTLTLTYDEALDARSVPAPSAYTLTLASGTAPTVANGGVAISGQTVTLTLRTAVVSTDAGVTLTYTAGPTPLLDLAGNQADTFSDQAVTNNTPDLIPGFRNCRPLAAQTYTVGTDVGTVTLPAATGGNGELAYTLSPPLPSGLVYTAAARTISGTPAQGTEQAATPYTYTVGDRDGSSATLAFTLRITPAVMTGAVTEDDPAATTTSGRLTLVGGFAPQTGDDTSRWAPTAPSIWLAPAPGTYTLDNNDVDTDALAAGVTMTDVFTAVSTARQHGDAPGHHHRHRRR